MFVIGHAKFVGRYQVFRVTVVQLSREALNLIYIPSILKYYKIVRIQAYGPRLLSLRKNIVLHDYHRCSFVMGAHREQIRNILAIGRLLQQIVQDQKPVSIDRPLVDELPIGQSLV
jgi:hypothetical protein